MTWAKIDDLFDGHPKALTAWLSQRGSLGLHMLALSHCSRHLTDGFVSGSWVLSKLPTPAERRRTVKALLDAGMWEDREDGYQIHDYLDYNPSRESVIAKRTQRSEAGSKGAETRWGVNSSTNGKPSENDCSPYGELMPPSPSPVPDPKPSPYPFSTSIPD